MLLSVNTGTKEHIGFTQSFQNVLSKFSYEGYEVMLEIVSRVEMIFVGYLDPAFPLKS